MTPDTREVITGGQTWPAHYTYVPALRVGNLVFLSGTTGSCEDIVQTTDYITTTENYKATAAVRREFFKGAVPTSTGVIVAGLLREGAVIEISAIAVLKGPV
jgi:enamine deaminase RidA (YjgF/YER057c/UK114 family)